MTLILNNEEIQQVLSMDICIDAVEKAFKELGKNNAFNTQRLLPSFPSSKPDTHFKPKVYGGFVPYFGMLALRICPEFIQFPIIDGIRRQIKIAAAPGNKYLALIYLYSSETGEMLGIFQDAYLQKLRVGATSAIGAKYLSREDSSILGLFGSGWQASAHITAICKVRNIKKVKVFSPNRKHRNSFANEMGKTIKIDIVAVDSPKEVVQGSDIVIAATSANEPVFNGEWLEKGVHVGSISSHGIELDSETFRRSDIIVINSKEFLKELKQMELLELIEAETISWDNIHELGKLVNGEAPTRENNHQITLFKNNCGLGIQFSAVGAKILEEAKKKGIGKEIPSEWFLQTRKGATTY